MYISLEVFDVLSLVQKHAINSSGNHFQHIRISDGLNTNLHTMYECLQSLFALPDIITSWVFKGIFTTKATANTSMAGLFTRKFQNLTSGASSICTQD